MHLFCHRLFRFVLFALPIFAVVATATATSAAAFKRILIVVLENTDYDDAIKQPFLGSLIDRGALLTNYYAQTHPSQPNYIALVAGSTFKTDDRFNGDAKVTLDARHVGDLLNAKSLSWKLYAEGYPGGPGKCFLRDDSGNYARKHVPFLSFKDVQTDRSQCEKIVAAPQFDKDVSTGGLPAFALYVPDLQNDGHDTGVRFADDRLKAKFANLLTNPDFMKDTLFVVTFDEGAGRGAHKRSHIATILLGDAVQPGAKSATPYTHYSLLRLVEDTFALGTLGREDAKATVIDGIWK